jgi:TetR/AcrR family transcriptional repressor of nem operon
MKQYTRRYIFKEDIIQAGTLLMRRHGFHSTSIKMIIEMVDIPKGSFYNYFKSKEQFGLEVFHKYCSTKAMMYKNILLNEEVLAKDRLIDFYDQRISAHKTESGEKLGCMLGNLSLELPVLSDKFKKLAAHYYDEYSGIICSCISDAYIDGTLSMEIDGLRASESMINCWYGALMNMKITGSTRHLEEAKQMIFRDVLREDPKVVGAQERRGRDFDPDWGGYH